MNFIATTHRRGERQATSELYAILMELGDESPKLQITEVSGVILGHTLLDPIEVSRKLREMAMKDPWSVRHVLRFIPMEMECNADLDSIESTAKELVGKIEEGSSFKVVVEKRHSDLSSREVIRRVAELVERKVDLENPDWIVLVEIVGSWAGVAVIRPNDIFRNLEAKLSG